MSAVISDGKTATLLLPNQASPTDRFAVGRDGGAWTGADTFLLYLLIAAGATPAKQPVGGVSADAGFVAVDPETGTCWIIDPASAVSVAFSAITGNASDNASLVSYVTSQINALIASAPGALDTLDELAAALGDDANFASTVTTALAGKASTVHTHTFSQITDGQEAVEDYVADMLLSGTHSGVSVTYTDNGSGTGTLNLTSAGVPGGATTHVQFNDGGALAGDAGHVWDKVNARLGVGSSSPAARLDVRTGAASEVGQIVRGAASQTADLAQWQDSGGTVLAKVNASGVPTFPSGATVAGVTATVAAPYTWQEFASGSRWGVRQAGGSGGVWCYGGGEAGPTAALAVQPTTTANNGVWVRGLAAQTADLTQWQDSTGAVVAAVTSDGRVGAGTAPTAGAMFHIKMPGTKQGFIVTNGDSTGTQTWFGFTTGSGPLGIGNDEYVNFYKDADGWIWNSDKGGTGTARAVRWVHAGAERMRINGTGIGFLGAAPAAQQAGGAATATGTWTATEQLMLQKAYDTLRTFGLLS